MFSVQLIGPGLNFNGWDPIITLLHNKGIQYKLLKDHHATDKHCDLAILLGYGSIVPKDKLLLPRLGTVLFHSSDLPKGRGWAPLYYTITKGLNLTQSLLYAGENVDSGNIIAKAHYQLDGIEVESEVRKIDDQLTLMLLEDALPSLLAGEVVGLSQEENEVEWWPRRRPENSKIDINDRLRDVHDHLRALPNEAPAYFTYKERRFSITLHPLDPAIEFDPNKVTIERFYK